MSNNDVLNTACEMTREFASTLYIVRKDDKSTEFDMIWEEDLHKKEHGEIICRVFCGEVAV